MDASILVLPEDEGSAQASITPTATTSSHQNSGNAVAGTAGNTINKAISMLLPSQHLAAEGSFHDTIPAATEPLAFPESASVDDFLTDLDEGIEPSLEPTLSDSSSTIAPSFASSTIKKVTSIASAAAFFAECLDSRPYRIFSVRTFCESLVNSRRAANARIVSVQRYGDLQGVPHRFLIMHVTRADGREFYLRLDRRRDRQVSWLLFGVRDLGTSRAIDTAAVSGRLDHLLDHTNKKSGVEAIMIFPAPVPLIAAAQVLYAIAAESPDYKLTKENCWFFASVIQEMLLRRFGAKYERGSLNHPTIGAERRDRITVLTYSHIAKDINAKTETVIKFADLMENSRLTKAVKSFIDTVNYHRAYHSSPPNTFQISTSTQALLAALQRTLHEHLHGLYGTQGARIFRNDFTDKLVQILPSLEQLQEDNLTTPISSIIHLLESSLQEALALHRPSSVTYDSLKSDLDPFFELSPGKDTVLFALELLGRCTVLDQLPTLWRFQVDAEIPDLQPEFERLMTTPLKFVCRHWITLLCKSDESHDDEIMKALSDAVPALLHWIAAMGIMGEIDQACQGMKELQRWLADIPTVNSVGHVIRDLLCLVERSRSALAASSLSILGSGLSFIPSGSALDATFPTKWAVECRIVSHGTDSSQPWSPQAGIIHSPSESHSVVFSPDGCHLVSACADGVVRIWDAATRALLREMKGHTRQANSVAYSPDGIYLASASDDCTVRFWDAVTGASLREMNGHTDSVNFVTFSPDGLRLASASNDHTVRVWDTATGELLRELNGHNSIVRSVSFSPDGRYLASDDTNVRIWDASTGALVRTLGEHDFCAYFVKFSPDGCYLASGLWGGAVHVWNVETGVLLRKLSRHTSSIRSLHFSPSGRHLVSASDDHTMRIWDVATGAPLRELKGHTSLVWSVNFSPDGCHLASASGDGTLCVWDVTMEAPPQGPKAMKGHVDTISSVEFSPDGCHLVSASKDGRVCVWDIADRSCVLRKQLNRGFHPYQMSFSADTLMLCIQGRNATKHFSFPKLSNVSSPISTSFHESSPSHLFLDHNALCIKREKLVLHVCWLPDYFKPSCQIVENGNHVSIGGGGGMIAFVNLDRLVPPSI